ncbi:integrase [Chitinispirillum alkaliphilum]|nr:integrase [Chitinispirillum alkaliphilum]
MDENRREQVALFRFSVIGSLISGELCHGELKKRIRELSDRRYIIPHSHKTRIAPGTIEDWLYAYRQKGLEGLKPKHRSDSGGDKMIKAAFSLKDLPFTKEISTADLFMHSQFKEFTSRLSLLCENMEIGMFTGDFYMHNPYKFSIQAIDKQIYSYR